MILVYCFNGANSTTPFIINNLHMREIYPPNVMLLEAVPRLVPSSAWETVS